MKNIPEINHCIPNPDAWWCHECKAHTGFDTSYSRSEHGSGTVIRCKVCEMQMSKPGAGENVYFMFICFGFGGPLVILGLVMALGGIGTGSDRWLAIVPLVFGALFGLGGRSYARMQKGWTDWCASQERKTESQLKKEGLNHPFQAEFEDSESFYEWAEQFFDSGKEWNNFRRNMGKVKNLLDEKGEATAPLDAPSPSSPPADMLDD